MNTPTKAYMPMQQTEIANGISFKSGTENEYYFELNSRRTRLRYHEVCALTHVMNEHIERFRRFRRETSKA